MCASTRNGAVTAESHRYFRCIAHAGIPAALFWPLFTAVALACVATATTGPIAFVAFLAGPIASRIVGAATSLVLPAALTGACLVLAADLLGQFAFDTKFPVGVITGILGAPYLLYLLIRTSRRGGSS